MDKGLTKELNEMIGAIKMGRMISQFVNATRYGLYKRLKESKAYKAYGKDWKDFCLEDLGYDHRIINKEIAILEELGETFLKAAEKLHLTRQDLLALGSGLSEDAKADFKKGVITIGDVKIKENEIAENLDELKEAISAFTKQTEETRAALKAQQRLTEDYRKNNEKLHKQLDRYVKKEEAGDLTDVEKDFGEKMANLRKGFDGYMLKVDPDRMTELAGETGATPRMVAAYLTSLDYMRKQILAAHDMAIEKYGTASMNPEEVFKPGKGD